MSKKAVLLKSAVTATLFSLLVSLYFMTHWVYNIIPVDVVAARFEKPKETKREKPLTSKDYIAHHLRNTKLPPGEKFRTRISWGEVVLIVIKQPKFWYSLGYSLAVVFAVSYPFFLLLGFWLAGSARP